MKICHFLTLNFASKKSSQKVRRTLEELSAILKKLTPGLENCENQKSCATKDYQSDFERKSLQCGVQRVRDYKASHLKFFLFLLQVLTSEEKESRQDQTTTANPSQDPTTTANPGLKTTTTLKSTLVIL